MSTRFSISFLFFLSLLFFSCSSDPCDEIECVNGSCNEGICDCAEGWKGPSCSEVDYNFVGEYESIQFALEKCPDPSSEGSLSANEDNEICVASDDVTNCLKVLLRFEEDGTFFLNTIRTIITSTTRRGDPTVVRGDYTTDGNIVTLCSGSDCFTMSMDMTQQIITWNTNSGTSTTCDIVWELERQ